MSAIYRPWGPLDWLLQHSPKVDWALYGAINTEDRSLAVCRELHKIGLISTGRMIQIENPNSRYKSQADAMIAERRELYIAYGGVKEHIEPHQLDERYGITLDSAEEFILSTNGSVILDVSSMPKRFFFPVLRVLLSSDKVRNLIVTYTVPSKYTSEKLAINNGDWAHLPTFSGLYTNTPTTMLIVGVGFEPMGLPSEMSEDDTRRVKLLFPFPASPKNVRRAWDFVQTLEQGRDPATFDLSLVDAKEISDSFDRLCALTENGKRRAALAPFGPKPVSLAMCLFAIATEFEVFYTQPAIYHPEYSDGVSERDGRAEIYGYWVKMNGSCLYLPPT